MKFQLVRVSGEVRFVSVVLTDAERQEVLSGTVPFGYSGGLGLDREEAVQGNAIRISGACFVDREAHLKKALSEFRVALRHAIATRKRQRAEIKQAIEDEQAGWSAFPGGRFADALRGTKSFPSHPRCPFKQTARVQAWEAGYDRAHESALEAHNS